MRSAIRVCAGRRPPASKNTMTAGHGPGPVGRTHSVVHGPSGVAICIRLAGMPGSLADFGPKGCLPTRAQWRSGRGALLAVADEIAFVAVQIAPVGGIQMLTAGT